VADVVIAGYGRGRHAAAAFDAVRVRQALPRVLRPGDVAATVAFLASDGAAALTGQVLCTPPSVTPSGTPQDPYSLATPSTFGCHRTTRT
jgi:NAD(P)-dependent dehydrogenase (short-subunit alcohol dehydrogenase family)